MIGICILFHTKKKLSLLITTEVTSGLKVTDPDGHSMKFWEELMVFWFINSCSLVECYQHFRETYHFHLQDKVSQTGMWVNLYEEVWPMVNCCSPKKAL
jgi:maltodextrin utilization protein YvdJ